MTRSTVRIEADLTQLPSSMLGRVRKTIERLRDWPEVSGVKPLRGDWAGHYRVRTGDWRIVFRVTGTVVIVVRVAHRKEVYE